LWHFLSHPSSHLGVYARLAIISQNMHSVFWWIR
jgi:ubiquinone/menaquinone biosynthesis C-methylase UbiE